MKTIHQLNLLKDSMLANSDGEILYADWIAKIDSIIALEEKAAFLMKESVELIDYVTADGYVYDGALEMRNQMSELLEETP